MLFLRIMVPSVGGDAMNDGYGAAQHTRPPDFARSSCRQMTVIVVRRVALDRQAEHTGPRIFDRDVDPERVAIVHCDRTISEAANKIRNRIDEAIGLPSAGGALVSLRGELAR